ncbi:hypothetical protein MTHERMOG20_23570 [Moorella thermoacetica]|uniref:Uncharacterized protein n=1 Tax=Moorella thermoacetica (strain ATCC 39073 / JCM 9320) TaxID=264732 RepID=Q2RLK5_MOOTA|nr:hypothetical protein MOOTH_15650 [Moorella thermoacetica]OIQ54577.1 hypothetical protein MOCA_22460 [Moorella thermoacetica]TYL07212.1 hypothetical protein MOOCA_23200 [Moorella thermoacetica]TYL13431.1 hypothetical protein MOCE_24450 [Moorella thermoacetica]GLI17903.1 hypothetical protein MTHERMOG20_23570 [Moorella thermoacetica]
MLRRKILQSVKSFWCFPKPYTFSNDPQKDAGGRFGIRVVITCIGISLIYLLFWIFGLGMVSLAIFKMSKIVILKVFALSLWVYFYFIRWLYAEENAYKD